jgi:hypothetical protein
MTTSPQAQQLRARAATLRSLSKKIGNSKALTVYRCAGTDTWVGPTPDRCRDALTTMRAQLQTQQAALLDTAALLEQRAVSLDNQLPLHGPI